jgi:hypothetical protein
MAAGISRQRETRIRRDILQRIVRELAGAQVPVVYHKATKGTHAEVWSVPGAPQDFRIFLRTLRASNGEGCIVSHLVLNGEHYEWLDFQRGLDTLKRVYQETLRRGACGHEPKGVYSRA